MLPSSFLGVSSSANFIQSCLFFPYGNNSTTYRQLVLINGQLQESSGCQKGMFQRQLPLVLRPLLLPDVTSSWSGLLCRCSITSRKGSDSWIYLSCWLVSVPWLLTCQPRVTPLRHSQRLISLGTVPSVLQKNCFLLYYQCPFGCDLLRHNRSG